MNILRDLKELYGENMKKIWKILALVFMVGMFSFALVGCSYASGIPNSKSEQIIFNGGIVSVVDDNIFFANGYATSDITTMDEYNAAANYSYLARLNVADTNTEPYSSPDGVVKINSEVTGYSNMYNFVLGDFVYYVSPNKHQTSSNTHIFTYISIFKTRLNGKDTKEIMTTTSFDSAKAQLRAVQFQGQSFLLVYDGTQLNCINLNNDSVSLISSAATSVALPKENESFNGKVYYTEDKENIYGQEGNEVYQYSLIDGSSEAIMKTINNTITFTGRCGDELFFTRLNETTNISATYILDAKKLTSSSFLSSAQEFYTSAITDVYKINSDLAKDYNGYVFSSSLSGNAQILYKQNSSTTPVLLLANGEFSSILFVYKDIVIYSTETGLAYKSVLTPDATTTIVDDMTIADSNIGYDFYESGNLKNIYFYAQRVYQPVEDDASSTDEDSETDANYYLYQVEFNSLLTPNLLSQTVI